MVRFKEIKRKFARAFIPARLLKSNLQVGEREKSRVLKEIDVERQWWIDVTGFKTYNEMVSLNGTGKLVKITGNDNYLPILRFRNPELHADYPPYLTVESKKLLDEIGTKWRNEMVRQGFDPKIRLAITSLSRTLSYQKKLVKAGKLADPESVHTKGVAFDIDAGGYYLGEVPINARAEAQNEFKTNFQKISAPIENHPFGDYALYDPKVHQILHKVLENMAKEGKLHFVYEFPNTTNDVFHVCLNPNYLN